MGQVHRIFHVFVFARIGRTFIEGHDDIGSDGSLDIHNGFRREKMAGAVDMALKDHAFFGDFATGSEGKDLITTAIGQNRAVPAHKAMQSAGLFQYTCTRPQVKMIGIAQDDLCLYIVFQLLLANGLDAAHRSHRHENRCGDNAVIGLDRSSTSL